MPVSERRDLLCQRPSQTAILIVAVLTGASGLLVAATHWEPRRALRPASVPYK
jgi:hypothetical protein